MKILHYSLGLAPYRSGGLTKYSLDLMKEQVNQGCEVYLLFPGVINNGKSKITYYKKYYRVNIYELINPLPVPLMNGTLNPKEYMKKCNREVFINFLMEIKPDIVHIHTLMGLYKEFLTVCKMLKIKVVYTSHDYFGICTKVNFIRNDGDVCNKIDIEKCVICNSTGDSIKKIRLLQSRSYRILKNIGVVATLKSGVIKLKRKNKINKELIDKSQINKYEYEKLLQYYKEMFLNIDKFIFNSQIAKSVYQKYINVDGDVISITHKDIKDNRVKKIYSKETLRLTYLGPDEKYKGYNLILQVMNKLNKNCCDYITLDVYGQLNSAEDIKIENVKINGPYKYDELKEIFEKTDILIVPSIWNETFGFITIEALSYGVPVLVTEKVGSKDLLSINKKPKGIIVKDNFNDLYETIKMLANNKILLEELNNNILKDDFNFGIDFHCKRIINSYELEK